MVSLRIDSLLSAFNGGYSANAKNTQSSTKTIHTSSGAKRDVYKQRNISRIDAQYTSAPALAQSDETNLAGCRDTDKNRYSNQSTTVAISPSPVRRPSARSCASLEHLPSYKANGTGASENRAKIYGVVAGGANECIAIDVDNKPALVAELEAVNNAKRDESGHKLSHLSNSPGPGYMKSPKPGQGRNKKTANQSRTPNQGKAKNRPPPIPKKRPLHLINKELGGDVEVQPLKGEAVRGVHDNDTTATTQRDYTQASQQVNPEGTCAKQPQDAVAQAPNQNLGSGNHGNQATRTCDDVEGECDSDEWVVVDQGNPTDHSIPSTASSNKDSTVSNNKDNTTSRNKDSGPWRQDMHTVPVVGGDDPDTLQLGRDSSARLPSKTTHAASVLKGAESQPGPRSCVNVSTSSHSHSYTSSSPCPSAGPVAQLTMRETKRCISERRRGMRFSLLLEGSDGACRGIEQVQAAALETLETPSGVCERVGQDVRTSSGVADGGRYSGVVPAKNGRTNTTGDVGLDSAAQQGAVNNCATKAIKREELVTVRSHDNQCAPPVLVSDASVSDTTACRTSYSEARVKNQAQSVGASKRPADSGPGVTGQLGRIKGASNRVNLISVHAAPVRDAGSLTATRVVSYTNATNTTRRRPPPPPPRRLANRNGSVQKLMCKFEPPTQSTTVTDSEASQDQPNPNPKPKPHPQPGQRIHTNEPTYGDGASGTNTASRQALGESGVSDGKKRAEAPGSGTLPPPLYPSLSPEVKRAEGTELPHTAPSEAQASVWVPVSAVQIRESTRAEGGGRRVGGKQGTPLALAPPRYSAAMTTDVHAESSDLIGVQHTDRAIPVVQRPAARIVAPNTGTDTSTHTVGAAGSGAKLTQAESTTRAFASENTTMSDGTVHSAGRNVDPPARTIGSGGDLWQRFQAQQQEEEQQRLIDAHVQTHTHTHTPTEANREVHKHTQMHTQSSYHTQAYLPPVHTATVSGPKSGKATEKRSKTRTNKLSSLITFFNSASTKKKGKPASRTVVSTAVVAPPRPSGPAPPTTEDMVKKVLQNVLPSRINQLFSDLAGVDNEIGTLLHKLGSTTKLPNKKEAYIKQQAIRKDIGHCLDGIASISKRKDDMLGFLALRRATGAMGLGDDDDEVEEIRDPEVVIKIKLSLALYICKRWSTATVSLLNLPRVIDEWDTLDWLPEPGCRPDIPVLTGPKELQIAPGLVLQAVQKHPSFSREQRNELLQLEKEIASIRYLFSTLASLIVEQEELSEIIARNVAKTYKSTRQLPAITARCEVLYKKNKKRAVKRKLIIAGVSATMGIQVLAGLGQSIATIATPFILL